MSDAIEIERLTAERDHYRSALAAQTARVKRTPLERQVIDAAVRWASLRPPHPAGAPARSTVQAAEAVLERSVLAMEAGAKRAAPPLCRHEGACSRCGEWMEIATASGPPAASAWVCSRHIGEGSR